MIPRPPLVAALTLLVLGGCDAFSRQPSSPPPAGRNAKVDRSPPVREAAVSTTVEVEGRQVVEIPLGSGQGIEAGTFFRILTPDGSRVKGMLQVTEVAGAERSIARIVALTDKSDPPKPGDPVRELRELGDVGNGLERAARGQTASTDAAATAEEARFDALREQYRRLLAESIARHDAEANELRQACQARITEVEAARDRALAARDETHRAEIASVRTEFAGRIEDVSRQERSTASERSRQTSDERDNLRVQVDGLLSAQVQLHRRIENLIAEKSNAERAARAQTRAEAEAREQLAARLAELEMKAGGKVAAATALLTRDPERAEGVLERLARLSAESTTAGERARRAEAAAEEAQQALLDCRRRLSESQAARDAAETKLTATGTVDEQLNRSAKDLEQARGAMAKAQERLAAAELSRLESERQLYDLAARVLRMPKGGADLAALQERLRALLGARASDAPATADPQAPERKP